MNARGVRHLPVVDGDKRLVGILSDRDIRAAYGNTLSPQADHQPRARLDVLSVGDVMTREPLTTTPESSIADLAHQFADRRVGAMPVLDTEERLIGMVSYVDILRALVPRTAMPMPIASQGAHPSAH